MTSGVDPRTNCALNEKCKCVNKLKPWQCANWGRSSLGVPAVLHPREHWGSPSTDTMKRIDENFRRRAERTAEHHIETEKRLREIRHSDPRKHLRKKGVRI